MKLDLRQLRIDKSTSKDFEYKLTSLSHANSEINYRVNNVAQSESGSRNNSILDYNNLKRCHASLTATCYLYTSPMIQIRIPVD